MIDPIKERVDIAHARLDVANARLDAAMQRVYGPPSRGATIALVLFYCALAAVAAFVLATLPGCSTLGAYERAHPEVTSKLHEVLNTADDLCVVVHAAHEAEASAMPEPDAGAGK